MTTLIDTYFTSVDEPMVIGRNAAPDQDCKPALKVLDTNMFSKLAASAPVFVPVTRYSVAELLRLRPNASKDVEVDVHHIENSIVSARQRAAFQSPVPVENTIPVVEPLFVPLYVPCQPAKQEKEAVKDTDSARSASPTVGHLTSEDEAESEQAEQAAKVKKVHRSRRGGKRHPNKNKLAAEAAAAAAAMQPEAEVEAAGEGCSEWQTVDKAVRANKNRPSKTELVAQSGEAFSSAVMRRRRLAAKAGK